MWRVVIRGLRRQLKLRIWQQPIHEVVQPLRQPSFQAKGIQPIDVPNNEPQLDLNGSQFSNNSHAKFIFHKFVWNKHGSHSFTCVVWTLISCALFRHECHMPMQIV
jgi:hypothetical protein